MMRLIALRMQWQREKVLEKLARVCDAIMRARIPGNLVFALFDSGLLPVDLMVTSIQPALRRSRSADMSAGLGHNLG